MENLRKKNIFYTLGIIIFFAILYMFISPPRDFPAGSIIRVEKGSSLSGVSLDLKRAGIIKSRVAFETFVIILGREKKIVSTDYYFENKLPVYEIARRLSKGESHIPKTKVTIPEGFNTKEIAGVFASKLVNFNKDKFLSEAKELEGYLFPDTYFFLIINTEEEAIDSMRANFERKLSPLRGEIAAQEKALGRSERQIIIMASLIEGEAKGNDDRELISGILWKRFTIGMPLQVDVAPATYKISGLPKSPIGNPGLESIKAAIYPKTSPYLYYLHDEKGKIHYAKTFAEHKQNILKYLK